MSDTFEKYAEIIIGKVAKLDVSSAERMRATSSLSGCFDKIKSRSMIYLESLGDLEVDGGEGEEAFKFDELPTPTPNDKALLSDQISEFNSAVLSHAGSQRPEKIIQTTSERAALTSALERAYMTARGLGI